MRDAIVIIISALGVLSAVVFMSTFHWKSGGQWRHHPVSRWLMLSRFTIGVIFSLVLVNKIIDRSQIIDLILIGVVGVFVIQMFWPSKLILELYARDHAHNSETNQEVSSS